MSSAILFDNLNKIVCQYKHKYDVLFYVVNGNQDSKITFFCQQCLSKQTLPQNAESLEKAKEKIKYHKNTTLELANLLIQRQIQKIQELNAKIDEFKSQILQQIDQSQDNLKLWRQQLETFYEEEKSYDIELELKSLNLNNEEYHLNQQIRLEEKILASNHSFYQKLSQKLSMFFELNQFQDAYQILNLSINSNELNRLKKELEEQELVQTQLMKAYPNQWFLRGNFENIQDVTKNHLYHWRNYHQNTEQIELFYNHMNKNENYLSLLFPNFYNSKQTNKSSRLSPGERNKIIKDEKAIKQLIENFEMYLCYVGVQLFEEKIIVQNQVQFKKFQNQNNVSGLQRVISSLSVLGQRENALLLVKLMKDCNFYYKKKFIYYDLLKEEGNQDEDAFSFDEVKKYFVEEDLSGQEWVSFKLFINESLNV
ncbi:unnamed protein product [Paramecium sonneborni]|uniref:Uncharacterized protein n=1 Tax=Paramecium sonneborni TaxID=65129 RepID=A0A8S1RKY6_9CILI|nr:unnamed protein product [Paramecium sonneborni]